MTSYNDIVPTDLQDELVSLRDDLTKASFRVGDIVLQVIAERPNEELNQIHKAVGSFVGKAERTVREYATVSAFYPDSVRQKFEVLAFDHFRVAIRFGEKWMEALEWAVKQVDEFNRPATVDAMEMAFENHESLENLPDEDESEGAGGNQILALMKRLKDLLFKKNFHLSGDIVRDTFDLVERIERQLANETESVVE